MSESSDENRKLGRGKEQFATTIWGRVLEAGNEQSSGHAAALELLCEQYWPPVYAYLRRKGHSPDETRDLTQGFFAFLIEHHTIARADPARGRFRNFLIATLENWLAVQRRHEEVVTRGVTKPFVAWDDAKAERLYANVLVHSDTPERTFEKRWALDLLGRVSVRLRADFRHLAMRGTLDKLEGRLWNEKGTVRYEALAKELGMSSVSLRVIVHRWRRRYMELVAEELGASGVPVDEVEDEINHVMDVLSR